MGMIRAGLIGLGKMGISHLAIANSHPELDLVAVCDTSGIVNSALSSFTNFKIYRDYRQMFAESRLDAVFVATPSKLHAAMVRTALEHNLHVFCEKPFCLNPTDSTDLARLAKERSLVGHVGYHFRFVGTFREAKKLISAGSIGKVHHVRAEAYGPVVVRPKGATWRASKSEGGGCLYDYACHAVDLINFLVGTPISVSGTILNKVFSRDVDDEVYSTFRFPDGSTGQLAANWSDESFRKMSTKVSVWGTAGRLVADRQELQIFLRDLDGRDDKSRWAVRNTTELTEPTSYYLRGEEYSSQVDHFVQCIKTGNLDTDASFESSAATDRILAMMAADASGVSKTPIANDVRAEEQTTGLLSTIRRTLAR